MQPPVTRPTATPLSPAINGAGGGHPLVPDNRTRVLVVDDSYFMQRRLAEILHSAPDLRVVGFADNGADAIRLAEKMAPDVITMDINMAKMDGLHAIDYIMRSCPRPIVIISSYTQKGSRAALYGLDLGVVDIVEKPSSSGVALDLQDRAAEIITKVRTAARVRVVRTLSGTPHAGSALVPPPPMGNADTAMAELVASQPPFELPTGVPQVIAMGASTGGPVVLQELLRVVPHEFFPPVLIVQHLPEKFTREFAGQLDAISSLEIVEACAGVRMRHGAAYLAPGGSHLEINAHGCLVISDAPMVHHCRPSVDVLFYSLARYYGPQALAFVLTGMGEDGAAGALAIKQAGGSVIAQDEASSVVFGMPAAAIQRGAVDSVLSLEAMKQLLIKIGELAHAAAPGNASGHVVAGN
jgi:two-component system, chemotaxis family, protein-glutamate methylesterase/glutaminase